MADIIKSNDTIRTKKKRFRYLFTHPAAASKDLNLDNDGWQEPVKSKVVEDLYRNFLREISLIFDRATVDFNTLPPKEIVENLAKELVDELLFCDVDVMDFFMRGKDNDYLNNHSVNVALLSVMVGVWLQYNKLDLTHLAIAAMLHDVGMVKVRIVSFDFI
ncbi:hypothetical protein ACFL0T_04910, partial [Candidatus Omnitrophota bacterium]